MNPNRKVTIRPPYSMACTTFLSGSPGTKMAIINATAIAPIKLTQNAVLFLISCPPINQISDSKEHGLSFSYEKDCLTATQCGNPGSRNFRKFSGIVNYLKQI